MATPSKKQPPRYLYVTTMQPHFQRCGIRFERDKPRIIATASLEAGQEQRLRDEKMLNVDDLTEAEAERMMGEAELLKTPADLRAALDIADQQILLLTEENDKLREVNADLLADLALIRGKANGPSTPPAVVGGGALGPVSAL